MCRTHSPEIKGGALNVVHSTGHSSLLARDLSGVYGSRPMPGRSWWRSWGPCYSGIDWRWGALPRAMSLTSSTGFSYCGSLRGYFLRCWGKSGGGQWSSPTLSHRGHEGSAQRGCRLGVTAYSANRTTLLLRRINAAQAITGDFRAERLG